MKKLPLFLFLTFFCCSAFAQRYVFFLHNMFLEQQGIDGVHPEYGRAEYKEILDAYKKEGFVVISELRAKNTDAFAYAQKVAGQVDSLLKLGVPAAHITVIGTSKGGYIAMYTSALLKNRELNYVFIGCCGEGNLSDDKIHFYGNVLSVYERSDVIGRSCQKEHVKAGNDVIRFKEIELNTGLKHGFLYKPLDGWIKPSVAWAKGDYEVVR